MIAKLSVKILHQVIVSTSAHHLWNIIYPGDKTPEWNQQCALNEVKLLA